MPLESEPSASYLVRKKKEVNLKSSREKVSLGSLIKDPSLAKLGVIWLSLKE